jgi:hypothetical protein
MVLCPVETLHVPENEGSAFTGNQLTILSSSEYTPQDSLRCVLRGAQDRQLGSGTNHAAALNRFKAELTVNELA